LGQSRNRRVSSRQLRCICSKFETCTANKSQSICSSAFLGKTYIEASKPAQALPYLNHAHSERPNDPEVLLSIGKANALLNRQKQAAVVYAGATRVSPENAQAWLGLGAASLEIIAEDGRTLATSGAHSAWARALFADELFAQADHLKHQRPTNLF